MDKFIKNWMPLLTVLCIHFILSHIPGDQYPDVGSVIPSLLVHVFIFTVIGFLGIRAVANSVKSASVNFNSCCLSVFIFGYLWGVMDEIHQEYFVANRGYQLHDLIMNSIGLVIGLWVWYALSKLSVKYPNQIFRKFL